MLYLEDYLECIEHLPHDLRDRFTEMRELDLTVQNSLDRLESDQQTFFTECKENKQKEWRDSQFDKLRGEYNKILEEADDKVQLGNHIYDLVDRYVRKLDQELQKYKMELEADNAGITETLEQKCLKEMAAHPQVTLNSHKSERRKEGSRKKGRVPVGGSGGGGGGESSSASAALLSSNALIPTVVSRLDADSSRASSPNLPSDSTEPSGSRPSSRNPTLTPSSNAASASQLMSALNSVVAGGLENNGAVGVSGSGIASSDKCASSTGNHNSSKQHSSAASGSGAAGGSSSSSTTSQLNYNPFTAMNNPAIAAAASQAIAATTHMQQGRRTSSLKASYEALRNAGELAKELTFGGAPLLESAATASGGGGSSGGNAYGPNAFVTDTSSTKPPKTKKFRPNNASHQAASTSNLSSAGLEGANLQQLSSSNSNLLLGSSPLNTNVGASSSSTTSSQLSTGQSAAGSQDAFQAGMDDYFGGGSGSGVALGVGPISDAVDGAPSLVGEAEFQQVDGGDWAYDPNEPRYCICNQVSYGEMVGCDNGDCPIEWFHYGCVGLTQAPKGKWFCPQCTAAMKRRNRR